MRLKQVHFGLRKLKKLISAQHVIAEAEQMASDLVSLTPMGHTGAEGQIEIPVDALRQNSGKSVSSDPVAQARIDKLEKNASEAHITPSNHGSLPALWVNTPDRTDTGSIGVHQEHGFLGLGAERTVIRQDKNWEPSSPNDDAFQITTVTLFADRSIGYQYNSYSSEDDGTTAGGSGGG